LSSSVEMASMMTSWSGMPSWVACAWRIASTCVRKPDPETWVRGTP
jgi:hypothetical protein